MCFKIVSALSISLLCFSLRAAPQNKPQVNPVANLSNEKDVNIYIQKSIDEILNASQYKTKVIKLNELYETSQKQSAFYTEELTQLFIEQNKIELDMKNSSTDLQLDSYAKLKDKINLKQKILENWNNIFVGFKPLYNLFVKNKKSKDLNCDMISHEIYLNNNGNKPDGAQLPPLAELVEKVALDICRTQDATIKSKK